MSTHAPGPGFRCAGLRLTPPLSVPGGIRGILPLQRKITLRYIQASMIGHLFIYCLPQAQSRPCGIGIGIDP